MDGDFYLYNMLYAYLPYNYIISKIKQQYCNIYQLVYYISNKQLMT